MLEATVPAGFSTDMAMWLAEFRDANNNNAIVELWEHESSAGLDPNNTAGYTVKFGAPGLVENARNYFRVSFRRASDQKWLCYSNRTVHDDTFGFASTAPTPPASTAYEVEDDFRRIATTAKQASGDGMGPDGVWMDDFPNSTAGNQPHIHTDEHNLRMPASAAYYNRKSASDAHSFAEVKFVPESGTTYNYAVIARLVQQGTTLDFFQAKLVKGHLRFCQPTLLIVNKAEADAVLALKNGAQPACLDCDSPEVMAILPPDACKQIASGNPEPSLPADPIWLRIEVDDNLDEEPVITGTMAWGCAAGEGIESCSGGSLQQIRTDTGDPNGMFGVKGQWAIEAHDIVYLVDLFRAGNE